VYAGDIAAFFLAAASIVPVTRRLGVAYGLWIAVNIFPPVAAHLFISLGRFTSVLFPLFFWLALIVPRPRVARVAGAFAVAQAVLAVCFFLWGPVVWPFPSFVSHEACSPAVGPVRRCSRPGPAPAHRALPLAAARGD